MTSLEQRAAVLRPRHCWDEIGEGIFEGDERLRSGLMELGRPRCALMTVGEDSVA